jgi:GntR family transcriptional regulator
MRIDIDLGSHIPIYIQLINAIKHQIATGELKPGDQLPTVRQLAADLRINFNTVARAYRMLDDDSIISTQHGRGTFILEQQSPAALKKMRAEDLNRLSRYYLFEMHKLGYTADEVQQTLTEKIKAWKKEGAPPAPQH